MLCIKQTHQVPHLLLSLMIKRRGTTEPDCSVLDSKLGKTFGTIQGYWTSQKMEPQAYLEFRLFKNLQGLVAVCGSWPHTGQINLKEEEQIKWFAFFFPGRFNLVKSSILLLCSYIKHICTLNMVSSSSLSIFPFPSWSKSLKYHFSFWLISPFNSKLIAAIYSTKSM